MSAADSKCHAGADAGSGHSLYKAFKFGTCKPSQEAAVVDHPDEIKAGIIEVKCDEVTSVGHKDPAPVAPVKLTNDAERKRLPEGQTPLFCMPRMHMLAVNCMWPHLQLACSNLAFSTA